MRIQVSIDDAVHKKAKRNAASQGKTLSRYVEDVLRAGMHEGYRPAEAAHRTGGVKASLESKT